MTGGTGGSNGRIVNNLVVLSVAHELTGRRELRQAVGVGMDYLLGANALGQSNITGCGSDALRHECTRRFVHDLDSSFPPPPDGALAGGPTSKAVPGFPPDRQLTDMPPQCRRTAAFLTP